MMSSSVGLYRAATAEPGTREVYAAVSRRGSAVACVGGAGVSPAWPPPVAVLGVVANTHGENRSQGERTLGENSGGKKTLLSLGALKF
ncbi:hypothetical protein JTE90_011636 [Oedothorax gibbosus]|uniref:Uncharacterized protein n=1 Tax=Oedothorax gibbosus TaxID=931172 RepID=A0AAV6TFW0_9ARAC|nr:hypothetical protein JTE90_011636 [Oedothorax gibbosus]